MTAPAGAMKGGSLSSGKGGGSLVPPFPPPLPCPGSLLHPGPPLPYFS
jgi:hypothetical protein